MFVGAKNKSISKRYSRHLLKAGYSRNGVRFHKRRPTHASINIKKRSRRSFSYRFQRICGRIRLERHSRHLRFS